MKEFIKNWEGMLRIPEVRKRFTEGLLPSAEKGVFTSYDFHLTEKLPQLIEINTNAGGALLNRVLKESRTHCCPPVRLLDWENRHFFREEDIIGMFREEVRLAGRSLNTVAIVDENPQSQFLYPEFLLFQALFEKNGVRAVIADPSALDFRNGQLVVKEGEDIFPVDLVYNRSTDFSLASESHAVLRKAWEARLAAVTPNPFHHALYARKSNLTFIHTPAADFVPGIESLRSMLPEVRTVDRENAEEIWTQRKLWFFKPENGYGSRGVYRGDKISRKRFDEIVTSGTLAQRYIPPAERVLPNGPLKTDIRVFTWGGDILGVAVRYYQGQATNFRTPGGGFAPLYFAA